MPKYSKTAMLDKKAQDRRIIKETADERKMDIKKAAKKTSKNKSSKKKG